MNHPSAGSQGEPPIGSPILGPAVPPSDTGEALPPRPIDRWVGPFLASEQRGSSGSGQEQGRGQNAGQDADAIQDLPWLQEASAGEPAASGSASDGPDDAADRAGLEVIESGVLRGADIVPIEALAPEPEPDAPEAAAAETAWSDEPWLTDENQDLPEEPRQEVDGSDAPEIGRVPPAQAGDLPFVASDEPLTTEADEQSGVESERVSGFAGDEDARPEWEETGASSSEESSADGVEPRVAAGSASGDEPYWEPWAEPAAADVAPAAAAPDENASDHAMPLLDGDAPGVSSEVLEEIAERLERIARSLRARDSDDLTGDSGDPLEVLITGYALGYSEGARRSGGAARDGG